MTKTGPHNQSGPQTINRLLAAVAENKKWGAKLELHRVFDLWPDIVGPEIAAVAQPSLVRGRVLWVRVAESIWMQQLHLQKMLLLEKINSRLTGEKFSDIRFQLSTSLSPPPEPQPETARPVLLDRKEEQRFDQLISTLKNEDLRKALKSFWVTLKTRGR